MVAPHHTEDEQKKLWNGTAGHAWVDSQTVLDQMFKPFEDLLVESVAAESGCQILDVGCGTGSTTLAMACRLGAKGHCTGVDISQPMIAAARARAEAAQSKASFLVADAQHHAFEPATFDLIVSRFGVMFFDDPVRAFANLRRAAKDTAELRFIAWRSAADNPFMTTAERAAAPLLPKLPARQANAPGQFAFADPHRMRRLLEASGWGEIDIQAIDVACAFPEQDLLQYLSRLGPVGLALQAVDEQMRAQVINMVRAAFDCYVQGAEVRFDAACWRVVARAVPAP